MRKIFKKGNFSGELQRVFQIQETTQVLRAQIENGGEQTNGRFFTEVQSQLVHFSTELKQLGRSLRDDSKIIEGVQNDIQKLLVGLPEKIDKHKQLKRHKKNSIAPVIMKIAIEASNLEDDVNDVHKMRDCDFLENTENKISELCTELNKINVEEGSASHKTREEIYVALIKCTQKLKKTKRLLKENTTCEDIPQILKTPKEDLESSSKEPTSISPENTTPHSKPEELHKILKEVKSIKKMIKCFSGFYENEEYRGICTKLNNCSEEIAKMRGGNNSIKLALKKLQIRVNGLFSRLEEKAIKV